jgi:hypothetical protein
MILFYLGTYIEKKFSNAGIVVVNSESVGLAPDKG